MARPNPRHGSLIDILAESNLLQLPLYEHSVRKYYSYLRGGVCGANLDGQVCRDKTCSDLK